MACYVCLDKIEEVDDNHNNSLCDCKGSSGIHLQCWDEWFNSQQGWKKYICSVCRAIYNHPRVDISKLPAEIIVTLDITPQILDMLHQQGWKGGYETLWEVMLTSGNVKGMQHLLRNQHFQHSNFNYRIYCLAEHNYLDLIQYLHEHQVTDLNPDADWDILTVAAKNGHLQLVRFLHEIAVETHCFHDLHGDAIDLAAENGHLDVVKFLHQHGWTERSEGLTVFASRGGHLDVVDFVFRNKGWSVYDMQSAARNGHLHVIKYLHKNKVPCLETALDVAAENGHLDVVQFLHNHRKEGCTKDAMDVASANGHLEVVQFLHKNRKEGCTKDAMDFSSANGHLDLVQFLHNNRKEGCTKNAIDFAATNGHLDIIQFLHENRKEGCTKKAIDDAAFNGYLDVVRFLSNERTEGCTVDALDSSSANGYLEIVKFLHFNRLEGGTARAMDDAASNGHLDVVKFLHEHRSEGCTSIALIQSLKNENHEILDYLYETVKLRFTYFDSCIAVPLGESELVIAGQLVAPNRLNDVVNDILHYNAVTYELEIEITKIGPLQLPELLPFCTVKKNEAMHPDHMISALEQLELQLDWHCFDDFKEHRFIIHSMKTVIHMRHANHYFDP